MAHRKNDSGMDVHSVVLEDQPQKLVCPVVVLDHCEHVTRTALMGHPQLAADHLLSEEMRERLAEVVGTVIRQLTLEFMKSKISQADPVEKQLEKIRTRQWAYEALIEIAVNLAGIESKTVGFSDDEVEESWRYILQTLKSWEASERQETPGDSEKLVAKAVVEKLIRDMKKVMAGQGMVAKMGEEIEKRLAEEGLTTSFISAAKAVIRENVYYRMTAEGLCKFGNDYAIGLRWLRHLGYVQVSTNPVLAARAYEDDPTLWNIFKEKIKEHPEWLDDPEGFGDEIAMEATQVALWPNLAVFRPIGLLSKQHDGMVSYQLNPNVAGSFEGSVEDAFKVYSSAQEFLRRYDEYLTWGYSNKEERSRPNIVFKVAGNSPSAVEITTFLNSVGIGTNNTVTYTVAQEVALIMAAMKGMAEALKKGILITQAYETNMGGRLESHLRDLEAEKLLIKALEKSDDREKALEKLAESFGASDVLRQEKPFEEKARKICSYKYLKSLSTPAFVESMSKTKVLGDSDSTAVFLSRLENDIGHAGTFVAQRVYKIFFSPENRPKWFSYLQSEFGVTSAQAEEIMDKIDILPASKRKPNDTLFTLARRNMTNTEFPNHQLNVLKTSRSEGFELSAFEDAILQEHDSRILERLLKLRDFRRAYELTPELVQQLRKVGVEGDFGDGGLRPGEWQGFGSVVKTMTQFTDGYNDFKKKCVRLVHELAAGSN